MFLGDDLAGPTSVSNNPTFQERYNGNPWAQDYDLENNIPFALEPLVQ